MRTCPQSTSQVPSPSPPARSSLAAAADGVTTLRRPLRSDDTEGFAEGLTRLGYRVGRTPDTWQVDGRPQGPALPEAGRVLPRRRDHGPLPADTGGGGPGNLPLRRVPADAPQAAAPLTRALRDLGVELDHEETEGHHPLTVRARGVDGGEVTLDAGQSSQYLTALLLLGPDPPGPPHPRHGPGVRPLCRDHDRDDAGVRGGGTA
ncbi:hypothetical protein ACRAWF_45410 [Streptomyces sp. L7]